MTAETPRQRDRLPRIPQRALGAPPEGRLGHGMRKFTLLDDAGRAFGGAAARGWSGEIGRRQRLAGARDPGGARRLLFGVGEGPADAIAEAKQDRRVLLVLRPG